MYMDKRIPDFMLTIPDNIYRTKKHIVIQHIEFKKSPQYDNALISHDTYFKRTRKRDLEYKSLCENKDNLDGKRIPSTAYTRKYVD